MSLATPLDRRQLRRQESIEEVISVAVEVMAEHGVAGLSLGEVARRMGIRTPSLYVYFPSKNALYDAVFQRGAELFRTAVEATPPVGDDLAGILTAAAETSVRWAVEHPTYAHLLFWRPVPGFEPSPEAYAPAVAVAATAREHFGALQSRGLIRADVSTEELFRDWTILISGVVSQQLSNAPDEPFTQGAFTTRIPTVVAMFAGHYGGSGRRPRLRKRSS